MRAVSLCSADILPGQLQRKQSRSSVTIGVNGDTSSPQGRQRSFAVRSEEVRAFTEAGGKPAPLRRGDGRDLLAVNHEVQVQIMKGGARAEVQRMFKDRPDHRGLVDVRDSGQKATSDVRRGNRK